MYSTLVQLFPILALSTTRMSHNKLARRLMRRRYLWIKMPTVERHVHVKKSSDDQHWAWQPQTTKLAHCLLCWKNSYQRKFPCHCYLSQICWSFSWAIISSGQLEAHMNNVNDFSLNNDMQGKFIINNMVLNHLYRSGMAFLT